MNDEENYEIVPVEENTPLLNTQKREAWKEIDAHAIQPVIANLDRGSKAFALRILEEHPEVKRIRIGKITVQVEEVITETGLFRKRRNVETRISADTPSYELERD